ncbi:MAG: methionyl-tRNA formyltransferase [Chlamydiales bacterium]|nr:methionyl-tRNA formyltransferase [Chlamydiia bacterium]MCP5506908.1 methionyl-tRNA formyltransferase [Chlamydiales bacterium]
MKVIYFGTPHFAADVLSFLLQQQIDVVAVVSRPDKPKGRSGKLVPTPVKEIALQYNIPVYQPEKVSAPEFADVLPPYDADLFVVVAYGEIIRQHVLDIPKKGCINLHASLLPKYRGAGPIQRAIIDGETETGVTIIHMVRKMDAGGMIKTAKVPIGPDETFGEIEQKLRTVGAETLLEAIHEISEGRDIAIPQDESQVTFAPKIELEDCEIDWSLPALQIHNLVRGVNPYPGAWCIADLKGEKKRIKILKTALNPSVHGAPGDVIQQQKNSLSVVCGDGGVDLVELQPEGKKPMTIQALLCGVAFDQIKFRVYE